MSGEIVSISENCTSVKMEDNIIFKIDYENGDEVGKKINIMVRPENIKISTNPLKDSIHGVIKDVIYDGAKNVDNAYLFIDYLLRRDVSNQITKEYLYVSPSLVKQNSIIKPIDVFSNGFYVKNIGTSIKNYDKLWADIK